MRRSRLYGLPPVATTIALLGLSGDAPQLGAPVEWTPAVPLQGSLISFALSEDTNRIDRVFARMAGQPLHFERGDDGRFHALGAVPVNARDSLELAVTLDLANGDQVQFSRYVPVTPADFGMERLSVAPRFSQQPDSALQERIEREQRQAIAVSHNSHRTPRLWRGPFVRPVNGEITSTFGRGREFNGKLQSRHMGVDLNGTTGTPIYATARGVVALVGDFYYSGNVVYIDHGRGLVTAYLHMSKVEVAQGDTVGRGQEIGLVGATGRVTGPHLHWIARYGTVSFDALDLLEVGEGW